MAMTWFWRMVCAPDCSDACQVNCPGCHAMADEWKEQGYVTPVTQGPVEKGRWRDFRYAVTCFSKSATAKMFIKLVPRRKRAAVIAAAGCGCAQDHAGPVTAASIGAGMGISLAGGADDPIRREVRQYYDLRARGVGDLRARGVGDATVRGVNGDACVPTDGGDACCAPTAGTAPTAATGAPALPLEVSAVPSYRAQDLRAVPLDAITASLGCGNPFAYAGLRPGEVVLDLGSGGGMDAIVASRRVGADGHVFGLDMSDEMIALAQRNVTSAGLSNVAFLKGDMESVPLPKSSVDCVISNCVVNLVPDKGKALREVFRVLRPGGRLSLADIVTASPVPAHLKDDLSAWAACIGGALSEDEYRAHLEAAGFVDIEIERDKPYTAKDAKAAGVLPMLERAGLADALALGFANTSVRASKRPESVAAATDTPDSTATDTPALAAVHE